MIRPLRRAMFAAAGLGALTMMLAVASPAMAAKHPKGEFAPFVECPTNNSKVEDCLVAKTESGEFTIGKEEVPITNTITLQGGVSNFLGLEEPFYNAENSANTLTKAPQKVPGGLSGLIKCNEISNPIERAACELFFESGPSAVYATTELAGSVKVSALNLLEQKGSALVLPTKIKLENSFLGGSCYVGSSSHPIVLELTSGTTSPPKPNEPISGSAGELEVNEAATLVTVHNAKLVNNSYSAPEATGCGGFLFEGLIDPIINKRLGLPSAAGHNNAVLKGTLLVGEAAAVKASE